MVWFVVMLSLFADGSAGSSFVGWTAPNGNAEATRHTSWLPSGECCLQNAITSNDACKELLSTQLDLSKFRLTLWTLQLARAICLLSALR